MPENRSAGVQEAAFAVERLDKSLLEAWLPPRQRDAHKGDMGHVLIMGGAPGLGGAALLASEAAARRSSDDMLSGWYMETPGSDKGRHFSTAAQATPNPCARAAGPPAAACLAAVRWLFFVRFFAGIGAEHVYYRALLSTGWCTLDTISIRGARTHNLKNIDLELPRDKLIVITGLSGSGKSSLAFDTLYAEGSAATWSPSRPTRGSSCR